MEVGDDRAEPNTVWLFGTVGLTAGDVRAGSVKRLAFGVGEGSVVVSDVCP